MKPILTPSVLALSLGVIVPALAQEPETGKPKVTATTPPVEVTADGKVTPVEKPATAVSPPVQIPTQGATPEAPAEPEAPAAPPMEPAAVKSNSSYGLGYRTGGEFGQRYGNFGVTADDIEMGNFINGFLDGFKGQDPKVAEEKVAAAMEALGNLLQKREEDLAKTNLEAGNAFLEANKAKEGIKTLESGLQYEVINAGTDKKYVEPKEGEPGKQFMVNYRGTLIDGTEFDASPEGQPVPMTLEVIEGFKEALQLMPIGAKWRLFIPSALAYADQRRSADIGPNSALIFELELVNIQDAPPQNPGGLPFPLPEGGGR